MPTPIRLYYRMLNAESALKPFLKNQFVHMMKRCKPVRLEDFHALKLDVYHEN